MMKVLPDPCLAPSDRLMRAKLAAVEAAWLTGVCCAGVQAGNPGQERERLIREKAAYYLAQRRGFAPGRELDDWLAAEAEVQAASRPIPHRSTAA